MSRTVAIGVQDFTTIRERNCFYIDKTSLIKEWWESEDSTTLITRPRRFGKTLNMSMLESFFSIEYADRGDLFEGLSVWTEEKYRRLQGTYPVISLSFANVKENTYLKTEEKIKEILRGLYKKYLFLLENDALTEYEKIVFRQILNGEMKETEATSALHCLSEYLEKYYGKKVIILLDEYDTPMQEAYVNGFWEELVGFMRSLFNSTFKTNPYLERAMMTGITRVSKESIFSDLNHLEVAATTSNKYTTSFGFTEEEVFTALEEYGMGSEKEKVKFWYDGFVFGKQRDIYNPWSIINLLDKKVFNVYWANTSSNGLVAKLLREGHRSVKVSFEQLLQGETIRCNIDEQIVYNRLGDTKEEIFSLLVASGYLKILSFDRIEELEDEEVMYELAITNYEVRRMFRSLIKDWFREARGDYNDFIQSLLMGNLKTMNTYMNKVALQIFSYFDTGKGFRGEEPERFYHGFVLGLLVELSGRYVITSNRESGFGRYDVMLEPKDKEDPAFIMEFKTYDGEEEEGLQDTVQAALDQIEEKQYEAALMARGIAPERIRKYGFAFEGKKVLIGNSSAHKQSLAD
ncbi:MAG: AAA family ATPase [Lachnospiraceae bacterium]|nr:AAA family ATPase [Lachnospiraceae bacterium]